MNSNFSQRLVQNEGTFRKLLASIGAHTTRELIDLLADTKAAAESTDPFRR
jgi:hypothetical protein